MRHFVAPDDSGFMILPDDDSWGKAPDGWLQVDVDEYSQRLAAQREVAEQRSNDLLHQARSLQREGAQALISLGLTAEQAAAVAGVSTGDMDVTA